jgi:hypothetical protein
VCGGGLCCGVIMVVVLVILVGVDVAFGAMVAMVHGK